jgi:hypothetical protein
MLVLKVSWDYVLIGVKSSDCSRCPILSKQNFSSPVDLKKVITPKTLILLRRINNRWKEEKVLYNSCVGSIVRFSSEQSHIYIFWLWLAVKSELMSAPKIFVLKSSWRIQGWPSTWGSGSMMWPSSYIRGGLSLKLVSIHLHESVISSSLQTTMYLCIFTKPTLKSLCTSEPLISLDQIILVTSFFLSKIWMEIFNSTTWIFFSDGIVGATSLNTTLVPLVSSFDDLSLERALPRLFSDIVHSRPSH